MIILLFGITNVGKTTTGKVLAQKMGYQFIDLDEEIKKKYQMTMQQFMRANPWPSGRSEIKGKLLKELVAASKDRAIIAVSLIWYISSIIPLFKMDHVIPVELTDSEEHIFQRLVFTDEHDVVIEDDGYKEAHKKQYIREVYRELMDCKRSFKKIEIKYFMDNRSPEEVADALIPIVEAAYHEKPRTKPPADNQLTPGTDRPVAEKKTTGKTTGQKTAAKKTTAKKPSSFSKKK